MQKGYAISMKSDMKSADDKNQTDMFYYRSADNVLWLDVSYNVTCQMARGRMKFGLVS